MRSVYIENIKQVYPEFVVKNYEINDIGQNNDVLILNNSLVFRFPKYKNGIIQLKKETKILGYIQNSVSIPVPHPIYQSFEKRDPGHVFTGYHLIEGFPLWKGSLGNITNIELLVQLASQFVSFLIELHSTANLATTEEIEKGCRRLQSDIESGQIDNVMRSYSSDFGVEFSKPIGLEFIELKHYLEEVLGKEVDLVTENALKGPIKDTILGEVIYQ